MDRTDSWPDRRAIWRWHFYAGMFCIPFVLWLAVTGSIYLFRPQIEAAIDAPYDHLNVGPAAAPSAQIAAALASIPGGRLSAYELPSAPRRAVRVMVADGKEQVRVYVRPDTLEILKSVREDDRFMRRVFQLHGELMAGDRGSLIVELAACWTIVMIVTGLILWWPRGASGLAGLVYPRLAKAFFWRDLHAVTGVWVSMLALFLLLTGLPWTKNWGGYLKEVRAITNTADGPQDWTSGHASTRDGVRVAAPVAAEPAAHDEHSGHGAGAMAATQGDGADAMELVARRIDALVATASALRFAPPVMLSPPTRPGGPWRVHSDAANRPLRADAQLDGDTADVISVRPFHARHPIDQAIGVGVAAHEGQLFGWANQLLGLLAALGLVTLSVSGAALWLKRRKSALFAPPEPLARPRLSLGFAMGFVATTIALPSLGISALAVLALERIVLRRVPPIARLLALR